MLGLGGLGDMAQMLKQAAQMKQKMAEIQADLAKQRVTATAGGGMVTVTMTGDQQVCDVKIDPVVIDPANVNMLEDLIVAATNEARHRALELAKEKMGGLLGGLGIDLSQIPGLNF